MRILKKIITIKLITFNIFTKIFVIYLNKKNHVSHIYLMSINYWNHQLKNELIIFRSNLLTQCENKQNRRDNIKE